ncbi:hypothetical protein [Alteribacillus persepolensis]|uniref:hypothetical protein n=1 Tax=Alteribacillus persepolensis TaxID=568899 RepID=UPI000B8689F1|nr:hypothetical protein [Alteribacillus persepolensis]
MHALSEVGAEDGRIQREQHEAKTPQNGHARGKASRLQQMCSKAAASTVTKAVVARVSQLPFFLVKKKKSQWFL